VAVQRLGLAVIESDEVHGYIDGLPVFVDDTTNADYDRALERADRLLELAKNHIQTDHWRREQDAPQQ
jgi:hypothetical protein